MSDLLFPCSMCKKPITRDVWPSLPYVGRQEVCADPTDPVRPAAYTLELRNHDCGTTLSIIVEPVAVSSVAVNR